MGIQGLKKFLYQNNLLKNVDMATLAQSYRENKKKNPILLVDALSLREFNVNLFEGGKKIKHEVETFLRKCSEQKIKVIVFVDGMKPEHKMANYFERSEEDAKILNQFFTDLNNFNQNLFTRTSGYFVQSVLNAFKNSENCEYRCVMYEADDKIAEYMNENEIFGVLTMDTDFLIFEGSENVFLLNDSLTSFNFLHCQRRKLAKKLRVNEKNLRFFAALCKHQKRKFFDIAKTVRNISDEKEFLDKFPFAKNDVEFYSGRNTSAENSNFTGDSVWEKIVSEGVKRFLAGNSEKWLLYLLKKKTLYWSPIVENTQEKKSILELLEPFRQQIYGILYSEHPTAVNVVEKMWYGVQNRDQEVAVDSYRHPGLLTLWSENPSSLVEIQKIKLFLDVIDPRLKNHINSGDFPENLLFSLLTLYLFCQIEEEIKRKKNVFLLHSAALHYFTHDDIQKCKESEKNDSKKLYDICGRYVTVAEHLMLLNSVCGNPFARKNITYSEILDLKILALVEMEDRNFKNHKGIMESYDALRSKFDEITSKANKILSTED